jgi:hypothetical protein
VVRNRFLAPEFVFIFGMAKSSSGKSEGPLYAPFFPRWQDPSQQE